MTYDSGRTFDSTFGASEAIGSGATCDSDWNLNHTYDATETSSAKPAPGITPMYSAQPS